MQFQVPQFIEQKAKIIGPLTFQQFLYFLIASGISFFAYFSLPRILFFLVLIITFIIAAAFAFVKIEGRPLQTVLSNLVFFLLQQNCIFGERRKSFLLLKSQKLKNPNYPNKKKNYP